MVFYNKNNILIIILKTIVANLVAKVNEALASGKSLTSTCWFEVDPAYGSDSYIDQGTEAKRYFAEKSQA